MLQRMHTNLNSVDLVTKAEISEVMGHKFDAYLRDRFRGVKFVKIPMVVAAAPSASTFTLVNAGSGQAPGPDQGFIWNVRRIIVASSAITDTATYVLYGGSDPSATDERHLIDAFAGGATPGLNVNVGFYPGKDTILWPGEQLYPVIYKPGEGNTYAMTGLAIEAPAEMQAKIGF